MHPYRVSITKDGMWPLRWTWSVTNMTTFRSRVGMSLTEDRARHAAVNAKISMERDDIEVDV